MQESGGNSVIIVSMAETPLRDNGRIRNALNTHAERQHEDEIENDVEHGGDDEE